MFICFVNIYVLLVDLKQILREEASADSSLFHNKTKSSVSKPKIIKKNDNINNKHTSLEKQYIERKELLLEPKENHN